MIWLLWYLTGMVWSLITAVALYRHRMEQLTLELVFTAMVLWPVALGVHLCCIWEIRRSLFPKIFRNERWKPSGW